MGILLHIPMARVGERATPGQRFSLIFNRTEPATRKDKGHT